MVSVIIQIAKASIQLFSGAPKPAQVNYGCQEEQEPGFKHSEVIRVGPDNYLLPF